MDILAISQGVIIIIIANAIWYFLTNYKITKK